MSSLMNATIQLPKTKNFNLEQILLEIEKWNTPQQILGG
jgi:hypothetical protein